MKARIDAAVFIAAVTIAAASPAAAQVRASEPASVSQTVDGTTVRIEYSRPVARGRSPLFGPVVRFDQLWTPGANWATTFEVDRDIRVNGFAVPRGRYSLWMIPRDGRDWTIVFSNRVRTFHTQRPRETEDLVRFTVKPGEGPHTEMLTWSFTAVANEGMTLRMQWGTTSVPLRLTVQPTRTTHVDREEVAPYLGVYSLTMDGTRTPAPARVEISLLEGRLRAHMTPAPPDAQEFDLMPAGPDRFHLGYYRAGKLFEVDAETVMVFTLANGRATGFTIMTDGRPQGRAERIN